MANRKQPNNIEVNNIGDQTTVYLPLCVQLSGRRCLVVGGGRVAERRIAELLLAMADVTVISPQATDRIAYWIAQGTIKGQLRNYESGDGADAMLIVAATDKKEVNDAVCKDAASAGQWINRVDCGQQSTIQFPAVIRRGRLNIAVSTAGASPILTAQIRDELESIYGNEYEVYLDFLAEFRVIVHEQTSDPNRRRELLQKAVQSEALHRIRQGSFAQYKRQLIAQLMEQREI